jgi:hypothetical protein
MLNLDTHMVLYLVRQELTRQEEKALEGQSVCISCMVLWELAKLKQLGRISLGLMIPALQRSPGTTWWSGSTPRSRWRPPAWTSGATRQTSSSPQPALS